MTWHLRLGHPGSRVLEHLVNASSGVNIKALQPSSATAMVKEKHAAYHAANQGRYRSGNQESDLPLIPMTPNQGKATSTLAVDHRPRDKLYVGLLP